MTGSEDRLLMNAARHLANLGHDVSLRPPVGTRAGGGTSDFLVSGSGYDVNTPTTSNPSRIITYGASCTPPHRPYAVYLVENTAYAPAGNRGFAFLEYDDAGNLTEAQVQRPGGLVTELRLTWDALGRLSYAEREESGVTRRVRFGYDYAGARVFKKVERPDGAASGAACGGDAGPIDSTWFEEKRRSTSTRPRRCAIAG